MGVVQRPRFAFPELDQVVRLISGTLGSGPDDNPTLVSLYRVHQLFVEFRSSYITIDSLLEGFCRGGCSFLRAFTLSG